MANFLRVYFYFGKNAFSVFAFLRIGRKLCVATSRVMHFSVRGSRHALFYFKENAQ